MRASMDRGLPPGEAAVAEPVPAATERARGPLSYFAIAATVMAMLAFGVLLGTAVSPAQPSSASVPLLVAYVPPRAAPAAPRAPAARKTPAPPKAPPAVPARTHTPAPVPSAPTATPVAKSTPAPVAPATTTPAPTTPAAPSAPALPPVRHVFLIVLSGHGYNEAFGPGSTDPYLAKTLPAKGELLSDYHAVAGSGLANGIALLSGQGPTAATAANCPVYADVAPGTAAADQQVIGDGCVYPKRTTTLPDQLVAAGHSWTSYVEDIGNGGAGAPASCRHPALGAADTEQAPRPGDAYVTWRNPLAYFHSAIDTPLCAQDDVGLDRLDTDLASATTTPSVSYIVPNRCHDGSDTPCAPGAPAGLTASDAFLRTIVPKIMASPAYAQGGLIAITFDAAPSAGPDADTSSCCGQLAYPNLAATDSSLLGGGQVGLLLLSPYVKPGTVDSIDAYNHFSLLRSIEDLFSLDHLGYAGLPGVPAFDRVVYNAPAQAARRARPAAGPSARR